MFLRSCHHAKSHHENEPFPFHGQHFTLKRQDLPRLIFLFRHYNKCALFLRSFGSASERGLFTSDPRKLLPEQQPKKLQQSATKNLQIGYGLFTRFT